MCDTSTPAHTIHNSHTNGVVIMTESGHLKLAHWPQLRLLPDDDLRDAARLCALLAVRPTPLCHDSCPLS